MAMNMNWGQRWEMVRDGGPSVLQSTGLQRVGHDWTTDNKDTSIVCTSVAAILKMSLYLQIWG